MSPLEPFPFILARIRLLARPYADRAGTHRLAGTAFTIRLASAACTFLSQIVFARWLGSSEFGTYVYLWTWVLLAGDLVHFGLAPAAQRFIPQYRRPDQAAQLRGFLSASRWIVFASGSAAAALIAAAAWLAQRPDALPISLACLTLPAYALSLMLDGTARSFNWMGLALLPGFILRPLLLIAFVAMAHTTGFATNAAELMLATALSSWAATALQAVVLQVRLSRVLPPGPKAYAIPAWLRTSFPILLVWGFYTLLTYTDVLLLQQFRPASEVALYYAASKTLTLVAFVYFAVAASVGHRYTEHGAAGDRARLSALVGTSVRLTFWPSLAATVALLAIGKPFLWLYGPDFEAGYPLMFIVAIGLLARASVGPAERLLSMLGQQRACALVYATAFACNVVLCLVLIPRHGAYGAALATALSIVVESLLLFCVARARLGLHTFIWDWRAAAGSPRTAT